MGSQTSALHLASDVGIRTRTLAVTEDDDARSLRELRKAITAARYHSAKCFECGCPLQTVVFVRLDLSRERPFIWDKRGLPLAPLCVGCTPNQLKMVGTPMESGECASCGRLVVAPRQGLRRDFSCSESCHKKLEHRRRSERRRQASAPAREKTCEVCGEHFRATRSDAKHCSKACKQKAYRARKKDQN